jgi:hypothetical protein
MTNKIFILKRFPVKMAKLIIGHFIFRLTHPKLFKYPEKYIPENTCYCYSSREEFADYRCPFWCHLKFLPEQMNGYCHYLNKSDYEIFLDDLDEEIMITSNNETKVTTARQLIEEDKFAFPASLLWDRCKECNINPYNYEEDENEV